mgnify:FL=1|tara:strand:+ start:187 stop:501 length:315 start_codon:yes stop_codon:yes gene_type:complete
MEDNLSNRIYKANSGRADFDVPSELSNHEKDEFASLITSGCRQNTKATIRRLVEVPLSLWRDHGIYKRVSFDQASADYPVSYCCGQEWSSEMRTLRDCLLGKFD